jgi:tRNA dimethylallyltransferase
MKDKMPIVVILGPTASGKTELAVTLARAMNGEIISADSRQIYRGLTMGTGKDLDIYQQGGVPVNYHLIDIIDVGEPYSVAHFQFDAINAIDKIEKYGKTVIVCGGTGLYLDALLQDYEFSRLTDFSKQALKLNRDFIVFGLNPMAEIRRMRCANRLHDRLNNGLIEEVEQLISNGVNPNDLIRLGLEYKWLVHLVQGEINRSEFEQGLTVAIQQFSKRQMTFFRKMERSGIKIHWISNELSLEKKLAFVQSRI